ncbi:hypothetical protein K7H91_04450 [Martelella mediterranea]|uniref:hypothetical protein n=1 Tax=Martelella mediterranea TaxID=293089 RepID=UPI001E415D6D|nr:hypothetical protein [Martelella mediterranea]MCD1633013.1 hypothetical protein [Martelella mediterranea]
MESESSPKRYDPAEYRVRLFLSVDLSGSTAFKNSTAGEDREEGITPKWVTVFQQFYGDFPSRYRGNYQKQANELDGDHECPVIWKAVGDELVFCSRVKNKKAVVTAVSAFIDTLHDYRKHLVDEGIDLNVKGSAWLAAFPEPNRAVQLKKTESDEEFFSASEALENAADTRPFDYDFLGKAIDTGFRVASTATRERFTLSVQLARLFTSIPEGSRLSYQIRIDLPTELKGVNKGIPYPMIYIDTMNHLTTKKFRTKEREILQLSSNISNESISEYLQAYCEVVGTDEIVLPENNESETIPPPTSYQKLRDLIATHFDQEKGREPQNSGNGNDDGPSEEDSDIGDELEPLEDNNDD